MFFRVVDQLPREISAPYPKAFLLRDNWDDWFRFSTMYALVVFDEKGRRHDLHGVKIGQFDMQKGQRSADLPSEFAHLSTAFFSLGQSDSYYEDLNNLGSSLKEIILSALNDVVADLELFEIALKEEVTRISLLRSVSPLSVRNQFRRLVEGGARLSRYRFSYRGPIWVGTGSEPVTLTFEVEPESTPPTNIHVLIGRNGVGKTYLLNSMTRSLVDENARPIQTGLFTSQDSLESTELFANLVSVTFSAFDDFLPLKEKKDAVSVIKYSYIGLKRLGGQSDPESPKSPHMLATEFVNSVTSCLKRYRKVRWQRSMQMLEADPIFQEADVAALADFEIVQDDPNIEEFKKEARKLFDKLSSGHKVVLLIMTKLVELVEERSLILLDEPEAHLHPPLLSAFVRALSDLLIYRNGVAVIATHSPVVLQEVPASCVWKLRRSGSEAVAERPEIETFGENVGILTREVFGLEVTQSGFHRLLQQAVSDGHPTYEQVLRQFDNELGAEARALVRSLIVLRDANQRPD